LKDQINLDIQRKPKKGTSLFSRGSARKNLLLPHIPACRFDQFGVDIRAIFALTDSALAALGDRLSRGTDELG
jgi:hypothetical protein